MALDVTLRPPSHLEPTVRAIGSTAPMLNLILLAGFHDTAPMSQNAGSIIQM
jgi:hypothetical protein